jgi:hypothetical protein
MRQAETNTWRVVNADFLQDRLKDLAEPVASLF